jgi:penicillin-binding protein 1A
MARKKPPPPKATANRKRKAPPPSRRKALPRRKKSGLVGTLGTLCVLGALLVGVVAAVTAMEEPDKKLLKNIHRTPGVQFLDRSGIRYAGSGTVYGDAVTIEELPTHVIAAILATEDRSFFDHGGINIASIARATLANAFAGGVVQGGSTITQQLAKNLFLTNERTFVRKFREIGLSFWLEKNFSKKEILALYLNRVYFGANTWGIDGAARTYFNKSAPQLSLPEAAMLVGLLKAPTKLNPQSNPDKAVTRAKQVLLNMVDANVLEHADAKEAMLALPGLTSKAPRLSGSRFFADWVTGEVVKKIGALDQDLVIETTLDTRWQALAENIVRRSLDEQGPTHSIGQGALLSMADDGAVMAMNGGYQYAYSQFNRATQAQRQPGSTFKIFIALAALRAGYTPETMLLDAPFRLKDWQPRNFTDDYKGEMSFEQAFAQSRNVPMVRLANSVGMGAVIRAARDMGIASPIRRDLSSALGSSEMTMLEMVRAFGAVSNGGQVVQPYGVLRIRTREGVLLYEHRRERVPYTLNADEVSGLHYFLSKAMERWDGTGRKARIGIVSGGKTGTSQHSRDAWFIGYAGGVTTGIWLGNDNNVSMENMTGGTLPALMWQEYVKQALRL